MSTAKPQTIYNEIFSKIDDVIKSKNYLDINSFPAKMLLNEAKKLMNANAIQSHAALCAIYQICCEEQKVREHLRIYNQLTQNHHFFASRIFGNLGLHVESQENFNKIQEPNIEKLEEIIKNGYQCYSFRHLKSLIDKAIKMKLTFNKEDVDLTTKVIEILSANNITDKQLAEYADVAGRVLLDKRLMSNDLPPNFKIADESIGWNPPSLFITFKVNVPHDEAAELYKEVTYKLMSKYENFPDVIHIGIESSL